MRLGIVEVLEGDRARGSKSTRAYRNGTFAANMNRHNFTPRGCHG